MSTQLQQLISKQTRYNHWANKKMAQWLGTLNAELLYREAASSFRSIYATLEHMSSAQDFWLTIIIGSGASNDAENAESANVPFVVDRLLSGSLELENKCASYNEDQLTRQIPSTDMVQCRYDWILHVINHTSYHRGQIVTMSRALGVTENIPVMDYEAFLWNEIE